MSRKGKPNNKPTIQYPRRCQQCSYMAGSAATFSYHKVTHSAIQEGQLCELGCNTIAKFVGTGGKYRCCVTAQHCSAYKNRHALLLQKQWENNDSRRDSTRKTFMQSCVNNKESIARASATKHRKLIAQDNSSDRRKYNRQVHTLSQKSYKQHIDTINPDRNLIGKTDFHLDHKVSKHVGFLLGIPAEYLASQHNLEILPYDINLDKGSKCSLHPFNLLDMIRCPSEIRQLVETKLVQLGDSFERLLTGNMKNCVLS